MTDADLDILLKLINGELGEEESRVVRERFEADPELRQELGRGQMLLAAGKVVALERGKANNPVPKWDAEEKLETLRKRIESRGPRPSIGRSLDKLVNDAINGVSSFLRGVASAHAYAVVTIVALASAFTVAYLLSRSNAPDVTRYAAGGLDELHSKQIAALLQSGETLSLFGDPPEELYRSAGGTTGVEEVLRAIAGAGIGHLNFALNSAKLPAGTVPQLDFVGEGLTAESLGSDYILITGHTDSRGESGYNQRLSELRAGSVRSYLLANFDIDPGRLIAVGKGEEKLLDAGNSEEAHFRNRRVEIEKISASEFDRYYRPTMSIDLNPQYLRNGVPEKMREGMTLTSRDKYRIQFKPHQDSFVYIYQVDASGHVDALFPDPRWSQSSPAVQAGTEYWLPGPGGYFYLDETVGTERILVLMTQQRATDVEESFSRLESQEFSSSEILTRSVEFRRELASRGVKGFRVVPDDVQLSDVEGLLTDRIESSGDVTIVFTFQHR